MNYHRTTGKRTRMKLLGLEGAGNDLDEIASSSKAEWKRPWWVRSVANPTIDVDWDTMERYDSRIVPQVYYPNYVGVNVSNRLNELHDKRTKQWILEKRPGYTLKDHALEIAAKRGSIGTSFIGHWNDPSTTSPIRSTKIFSPDDIGVPRWEGSPEENARLVRSALRFFGAGQVGFVELDEKTRKLIYSFDSDGKKIEFEDADMAYETKDKRVIPNKARWVIVFSVQMSEELLKRREGKSSTALSSATNILGYSRGSNILDRIQTFLHVLGYQGLAGPWYNGLGIAPALGAMAGLGEISRLNLLISPEYGPMQRIFKLITDLPLAPTGTIDTGIMRFCKTCKKCSIICPAKVLDTATEPTWETTGPWSNPGHRTYTYQNSPKCMTQWKVSSVGCSTCLSVCPFSKKNKAFIHTVVQATIAKTSLFNSFFTLMDGLLGYDIPRDAESWWDLDLPLYSNNSTDDG